MTTTAAPRRPSRLKLESATNKLRRQLTIARAGDFFRLIWAVDTLHEGRTAAAREVIKDAPEIASAKSSGQAMYKWELETLVTEYLSTPQEGPLASGGLRMLLCDRFQTAINLINALRNLEDIEAGFYCTPETILAELARISQRQFPWQQGYVTQTKFYRSAFIYGQGSAATYFKYTYGLSYNEFSIVGFSFAASSLNHAAFTGNWDLGRLGVQPEAFHAALRLLCASDEKLRALAKQTRVPGRPISYQASPLRQFPAVQFSEGIVIPLRELLILRTTTGVYYDLVGAGGAIRDEIARRFEEYSASLLEGILTDLEVQREYKYGPKARQITTPDILLKRNGHCVVITECKATKLTLAAQFGENPSTEAARGYEELSKGIYQIWRFCGHTRLGRTNDKITHDVVGLLLTLDAWAMMSVDAHAAIFAGANALADQDSDLVLTDRIPVAIAPIDDIEIVLTRSSDDGFVSTLRKAAEAEFAAWLLPGIQETHGLVGETRRYPLHDRLSELLPWWGVVKSQLQR